MTGKHTVSPEQPRFGPLAPFVEPSPRWVRVRFGGEIVADSRRALLLGQIGPGPFPGYGPTYYFPQQDVRMEALAPDASQDQRPAVSYQTLRVGTQVAERGAWIVKAPPPAFAALHGMVSFRWEQMDGWYEEEEQIFVHARIPYHRVDVLASSRHVRVALGGVTLAETRRPHLLFETYLPTRYYIPPEDVRMELLTPTARRTQCPYKGVACYWSATAGGQTVEDLVWSYPDPIRENPKIKGLLCFFNERVDLHVDGELQPRPLTPWSQDVEERYEHP
ncbi:MAG: DUF427 domain-containing protein [Chloroflexales bacterium]|nr:DUF427 domain-containing protein [Chloroflexales bacterium]